MTFINFAHLLICLLIELAVYLSISFYVCIYLSASLFVCLLFCVHFLLFLISAVLSLQSSNYCVIHWLVSVSLSLPPLLLLLLLSFLLSVILCFLPALSLCYRPLNTCCDSTPRPPTAIYFSFFFNYLLFLPGFRSVGVFVFLFFPSFTVCLFLFFNV